ncbi:MAG TPA: hypothetical protein VF483_08430 [Gemmatimonadaceae bacterium]
MTTAMQPTPHAVHRWNGHVSRVSASDLPEISEFLRTSFDARGDAPFASVEMLRWKYLEPAEHGLEDAAFVLGASGRIVAHAGLRTTRFAGPDGTHVTLGTIIDWAADRAAPGAGIALYRHLMGQAHATYLIGGTPTTQAVAERLGFRRGLRARVFARWVRPLDEFLQRPKTARSALRLLHGVAHGPLDRLAPTGEWRLREVPVFDASIRDALSAHPAASGFPERTVAALNHRLRNPMAVSRAHVLFRGDHVAGCAVSSLGTWNARILLLQGRFENDADQAAAYALVTSELARDPHVCRVSVLSTTASQQHALAQNGYWLNRAEPVSFYDPSGRSASLGTMAIQYFDADLDDYSS